MFRRETQVKIEKAAGWGFKAVEKLLLLAATGLALWAFSTLDGLQDRMTKMEESEKQDSAQWRLLQQYGERIQEQEIKNEVRQRVWEMVLHQNGIKIDRLKLKGDPDAIKRIEKMLKQREEERAPERFRNEQMQMPQRPLRREEK